MRAAFTYSRNKLEKSQNEILNNMVNQEKSENIVAFQLNSLEDNIVQPQIEKSAYMIGLLVILSQLKKMKQQRVAIKAYWKLF